VKIKPFGSVSSTGKKLALVPGMEAQVDVITGKRTILSYVTAPITATLQEAFTEQ
jgi:multidrug efflux pump subunit AcrA (membrane-fusion protein)